MTDASAPQTATRTRTAAIADVLRADIIEARLAPGTRLRFDELRMTYNVGISPLREALMHLASEGLVISEQHKGYRVAPVSADDLREIATLRGEFDALAIRQTIASADDAWESRMIAAFHALQKREKLGPDGEIDPDWERSHIAFHAALVSGCDMPKLSAFRSILDLQARRYRRLAVHYLQSPRDDLAEHTALRDAMLAKDEAEATRLIKAHYWKTVEVILNKEHGTEIDATRGPSSGFLTPTLA